MTRRTSISTSGLRRLAETAPALALAVLLGLPLVLNHGASNVDVMRMRNAMVQQAVDAVPYRVGSWVGEDVEVPPSAIEILRPNAILSRRYDRLGGGGSMQLLIVHCSDARDMQGHHPPVCYPAHGWMRSRERSDNGTCSIQVGGEELRLRIYNFRMLDSLGGEKHLRVFNYFLLPDGETTIDLDIVNRVVERSTFSVEGVAQVQLVMDGNGDLEEARRAAEDLLNETLPHLAALSQGEMTP